MPYNLYLKLELAVIVAKFSKVNYCYYQRFQYYPAEIFFELVSQDWGVEMMLYV